MSRRQTLGVLSPSALNARASQAGRILTGKDSQGGLSSSQLGGASVPAKARKSLAPSAMMENRPSAAGGGGAGVDRRSSAFGGKPSGPKQDPRPLGDKNFLNNCVHTLITYLSVHGYPAAVSPKTLASPTAKDFTMIVQFLFQVGWGTAEGQQGQGQGAMQVGERQGWVSGHVPDVGPAAVAAACDVSLPLWTLPLKGIACMHACPSSKPPSRPHPATPCAAL